MAAVSTSVVHLTMRYGHTVLSIGTGVLYERDGHHYIVTAWHNVTGLHPETMQHLSETLAVPDNIVVTIAVVFSGNVSTRMSIVLPLTGEQNALFYIHPKNWPRVDVVAIAFDPTADHTIEHWESAEKMTKMRITLVGQPGALKSEICPVQKYQVPDKKVVQKWLDTVEVTEELFIPGYPHNIQDHYSQPVWKRATIASSVQDGWNREPKFLVDSASKSGMSGSPVLYYNPNGEVRIMGSTYRFNQEVAILAGIYVGRIGVSSEADPQIGTVWHQSVIDEIIDSKCYERLPAEIEAPVCELEVAVKKVLSSCSRKGLENVKNEKLRSRFNVQREVLKIMNGCASPRRALEVLLAVAATYDGPLVQDENE